MVLQKRLQKQHMLLNIRGKSKSLTLSDTRKATRFYINTLFIKNNPEIIPELEVKLHFVSMSDRGECDNVDDREVSPRYFDIYINQKLGVKPTLKTIAHECVHVWQFATNQLRFYHDEKIVFRKKSFNPKEIDYWELPSEIDAFGREEGLFSRYIDHLNSN